MEIAIKFAWNVAIRPDAESSPFQINSGFSARLPGVAKGKRRRDSPLLSCFKIRRLA